MLSYVENDKYFLSMEMSGGDCVILLRRKLDENHGERIYTHYCKERTQKTDFAIYNDLEERIKSNTLTDEYVQKLSA